ncbi:MAG: DUF1385 domain-containing protein [Caldibacillus sp.]
MKIYGGRAGINSVVFSGKTYHVKAILRKGKIVTKTWPKKRLRKTSRLLNKIPFIRGLTIILNLFLDHWKTFFLLAGFWLLAIFLLAESRWADLYLINETDPFLFLLLVFCLIGIVIKIMPVSKYHADEHMAANAYAKKRNLSLETIKKQPRTHDHYRTNLAFSFIISYGILSLFIQIPGDILAFLAWCMGYELWLKEPKYIWPVILAISKSIQYLLLTKNSDNQHIQVAVAALSKLKEIEQEKTVSEFYELLKHVLLSIPRGAPESLKKTFGQPHVFLKYRIFNNEHDFFTYQFTDPYF